MAYLCSECSYQTSKWVGFCPQCRGRDTIVEVTADAADSGGFVPMPLTEVSSMRHERMSVEIGEIDHVLGGGLVAGSTVLLGGEPGVGKSTLLLHLAAAPGLAGGSGKVLIATGEESAGQVGLRARRVKADAAGVAVVATRDADGVVAAIESKEWSAVIVDSIQTMVVAGVDGHAGGVTQVRESTARLIAAGKASGTPVILVGHVTKDGAIAGPKTIEHMVDVVMHLDTSDLDGLRFLRCLKNRFGSTDRVGIFEMTDHGLTEVPDPVGCLVGGWRGTAEGTVLFPSVNGRRPLLVEVQALVSPSAAPQPRRSTKGVDAARVHQMLAVLEKHAGMPFSRHEVYVSLAGGISVREPAVDLPIALALASSLLGRPVGKVAAWGEVGLTGELRAVGRTAARVEEVTRLGIDTVVSPETNGATLPSALAHAGLMPAAPGHLRRV